MTITSLRYLADLLDGPDVFDRVVDAIADARDEAPRVRDEDGLPLDRDSGEVLDAVIRTLRGAP